MVHLLLPKRIVREKKKVLTFIFLPKLVNSLLRKRVPSLDEGLGSKHGNDVK